MTIAPEGRVFCGVAAAAAVGAWLWGPPWLAILLTLSALFCLNFFRDPARVPPPNPDAIISPADGTVMAIAPDSETLAGEPGHRVSIFMSVFNVHVNRAPFGGVVKSVSHHPGKFVNAMAAEASDHNEQTRITVQTERGQLVFKQIAGLIARRIICYCQPEHPIQTGERIGLIRFGSRVDVVVPTRCTITVQVGEKVRAGESILGTWPTA